MITVRNARDRGRTDAGWLDSRHTFSFADYYDPAHMGFRTLRVINDDRVNPGSGFGTHPHKDMEIVSYVLAGALAHEDSMGNGSVIRPGDVQRMSAGTGVTHSEWNHSKTETVHFLQIWILPQQKGIEPGYEQKTFEPSELQNQVRLVASQDGRGGSLTLHQDASIYVSKLSANSRIQHDPASGRHVWVQMASGRITVNDVELGEGDGAAIDDESRLALRAITDAEVLIFDLA
jgi:redox-sensitive bicupin YhaK (pirin superfamily)